MDDIRIRLANPADLPHILHHRLAMFEEMGHTEVAVLDRVQHLSEAYFHDALRDGGYRGWIAETGDGQVVGGGGIVIAVWPGHPGELQARRAWILNMYTEPGFRRRGIARRLMQVMTAWCRATGFNTVSLHASKDGRALYEALGFQATNEMRLDLKA
jgi:GNAT superfamily N-acetyltransferase